jgi:acyl-CoA thioester hydrolase
MAVLIPEKPAILTYSHYLRSRYGETDKMGYVYYGHYLSYFEVARTEMIRSLGISYSGLEDQQIMLPVIHSELDYHHPVFYDEEIEIKVTVFDIPTVRLITYYEVRAIQRDVKCVTGEVTLCFVDAESRRPCRAPAHVLEHFK